MDYTLALMGMASFFVLRQAQDDKNDKMNSRNRDDKKSLNFRY